VIRTNLMAIQVLYPIEPSAAAATQPFIFPNPFLNWTAKIVNDPI
jgi:hypothetical protein